MSKTCEVSHAADGSDCGMPAAWRRTLYASIYGNISYYCQDCYDRYGPTEHIKHLSHMRWRFDRLYQEEEENHNMNVKAPDIRRNIITP